jgi:outer membrane receptor for ferric coprogen and ferric-rhodotorulic acid
MALICSRGSLVKALMLLWCLGATLCASSQSAAPAAATQTPEPPKPAQQIPARDHHGGGAWRRKGRLSSRGCHGGHSGRRDAAETPLSATVVTRDLLNDQGARLLSDVVKNDASIGEDYAPVGYYGDYEIRGFPIDLATGLRSTA